MNEADDAARRERAAREAEQEDLVSGLVVLREKHVGGPDIVVDAVAERAFDEIADLQTRRADPAKVEDDLLRSTRPMRRVDRLGDAKDVGLGTGRVVGRVPGAVTADDKTFHGKLL